jgi:DNA-binding transcriptional LysR family regulator
MINRFFGLKGTPMDLQKLKTFRTAATLLNFNRAAEVLNYAQSTISAQIKALETEVGVPLFARIGKQVRLTDAGAKMVVYADKLLAMEDEALADVTGRRESAGVLALRAPQTISTYYLPQVLAQFQRRFPQIRLDVSSCAFYGLERELQIGTVDLAFLLAESVQAANLEAELLCIEPLAVIAPLADPLANRSRVGFKDLQDRPIFLPKADCGYRMAFEQALMAEKVQPAAILEFNSIEAIKKCVMLGLGISVLPEIAVMEELRCNKLVRLAWDEEMDTAVLMIRHRRKWVSPTLQAFMETVKEIMNAGRP